MKAYEFNAKITADGKLEYPEKLLQDLPPNQEVRMIILINENPQMDIAENNEWSRLATEQFFADYSEDDQIYNHI